MQAIESGWGETERVVVDGNNVAVDVCVRFSEGKPERVSVVTEDSESEVGPRAVRQVLRALGFTGRVEAWETGEAEHEGVAFLEDVAEVRRKASVTLYADGMGEDATEDGFDAFLSYVCEHIDEATGLDVAVEAERYGTAGATRVRAGSADDEQTVRDAVEALWGRWCSEGAPGAEVGS
jgi:hypothetical protein